jgi:chromosome segregation ATPase
LDENTPKISEYQTILEKCKRLEKENRNLAENNNILKEQFNEGKNRKLDAEKNYDNIKLENMILKQNNENLKKNLIENDIKIKSQEEKIAELENDLRDMNKRNQNYIDKLTEKNLSLDNTYKEKVTKELNEMRNRYENDIFMLKKQYDDLSE